MDCSPCWQANWLQIGSKLHVSIVKPPQSEPLLKHQSVTTSQRQKTINQNTSYCLKTSKQQHFFLSTRVITSESEIRKSENPSLQEKTLTRTHTQHINSMPRVYTCVYQLSNTSLSHQDSSSSDSTPFRISSSEIRCCLQFSSVYNCAMSLDFL